MEPFLKEKRVPPQTLLLQIISRERHIYSTRDISYDRKIGFYELLRKAFAFESFCVNNFEIPEQGSLAVRLLHLKA